MSDLQKFAIEFPLIELLKLIVSNEQMESSPRVNPSDFKQCLVGVAGPGLPDFVVEPFELGAFRAKGTDHFKSLFPGKQGLFRSKRSVKGGAEQEFVQFTRPQGLVHEHEVSVVEGIETAPEKSNAERVVLGSHFRVTRPGLPTFRRG